VNKETSFLDRWLSLIGWAVALGAAIFALYLWQSSIVPNRVAAQTISPSPTPLRKPTAQPALLDLPPLVGQNSGHSISRRPNPYTIIPNRPRTEIVLYTVQSGDSVFGIAETFGIKPETVLWANYELLNDNPDFLEPGMELNIPPVDGVYYQWQEGDTLEGVATQFDASVEDILSYSGNSLDLANPEIPPGSMVMIPGGQREFRQWLIPTIARGSAGVNTVALGPGACTGSYEGAYGSGAFIWPISQRYVSGNDYWSGHLALDLAAGMGEPVMAADAGVVVFSGWAVGGYGNMVLIDHGNGYQTLYAHMSGVARPCGASVGPGTVIGYAGSTGNSTGAHLHFEVRLNGGFINPWFVLPPP